VHLAATAKDISMPPDDLPIDQGAEDSTKSPGTKRLIRKDGRAGQLGAEAEARGGSESPDEPPIEQQQRQARLKR